MPNYDYECDKCGVFEKFQWMNADPLKECPTCKGSVKRLIGSKFGFVKDSWVPGWYEHIDVNPIKIESKAHLKHECEKRGLYAKGISKRKSIGKGITWR